VPQILFLLTPYIDKEPCQLKPLAVACQLIEFYKAYLYLLVPGCDLAQSPPKLRGYQFRVFQGHIKENVGSGGQIVRYGSFIHMPHIIELVADPLINPALPACSRRHVHRINRTGGIEISVLFLGRCYKNHEAVNIVAKLRIRRLEERPARPFNDFEYIRVIVPLPGVLSLLQSSRNGEIVYAAGFFAFTEDIRNGNSPVSVYDRFPEAVIYCDCLQGRGLQPARLFLHRPGGAAAA